MRELARAGDSRKEMEVFYVSLNCPYLKKIFQFNDVFLFLKNSILLFIKYDFFFNSTPTHH